MTETAEKATAGLSHSSVVLWVADGSAGWELSSVSQTPSTRTVTAAKRALRGCDTGQSSAKALLGKLADKTHLTENTSPKPQIQGRYTALAVWRQYWTSAQTLIINLPNIFAAQLSGGSGSVFLTWGART